VAGQAAGLESDLMEQLKLMKKEGGGRLNPRYLSPAEDAALDSSPGTGQWT
jgi:hypothetical protein